LGRVIGVKRSYYPGSHDQHVGAAHGFTFLLIVPAITFPENTDGTDANG
jgi:hypothetical protein